MSTIEAGETREQKVIDAFDDYLTGKITLEEYEALESLYRTDYLAVARALAGLGASHRSRISNPECSSSTNTSRECER
ncbi:MAG: hypothetical protein V9F06_01650 [Thermomicrobiales bacterium]|jgi:hypothetical protein|nr:hypothetical protein [Chloroflexota bacterium]